MLTANDALHGWSPTDGDDEDVHVSQDRFFMTIRPFPSCSTTFLSPVCPPLDPPPLKASIPPSQPSPLTPFPRKGVSHSPAAPSSDRRAQRNRNRDPSWVPRPRNAFIIFRCDYSREHSQGARDSQNDDDPNASVKTLSKCAAEAWKQLHSTERERYKALAEKERVEHARLYPNYRFRPVKRQASSTRKTSSEGPKGARVSSTERPPAPSTHLPSVLSSAPEESQSRPLLELAETSVPLPQVKGASLPEISVSTPVPRAPLLEPSFPVDSRTESQAPLELDYSDPFLFFSSPDTTTSLSSDSSPPTSADLYSSWCRPTFDIPDTLSCHNSAFGLDPAKEDLERTQALEAYAMGLYNFDMLSSSFPFPEYC